MSVDLKILLFGPARDAMNGAASACVVVDEIPLPLSLLRERLVTQYPQLRFVLMNAIFAYQNKLVPKIEESVVIVDNLSSEIILIPPVSGG